ncbi:MAG: hypothetical protein AAFV29_07935, partial [Myxococcota bacterium]
MYMRALTIVCFVAASAAACSPPPKPEPEPEPPAPQFAEPIGPEPMVAQAFHVGQILANDSLSTALARKGVQAAEVSALVRALRGLLDVRVCRPGEWFEVWKDEQDRLSWFRYHRSKTEIFIAYRDREGQWHGREQYVHVTTTTAAVAGRVDISLYASMARIQEQAWLPLTMVDIFAWDIDFFTETRAGDQFRVVVEKRSVDGESVGYGRLLAVEYTLAATGRTHRAFRYESSK